MSKKQTLCECVAGLTHKQLHALRDEISHIRISDCRTDCGAVTLHQLLSAIKFQIALEQGCE